MIPPMGTIEATPCATPGCDESTIGFAAASAPRTASGLWYCDDCRTKRREQATGRTD